MLDKFNNWLKKYSSSIFHWHQSEKSATKDSERSLVKLPVQVKKQLVTATENLPINPSELEAIIEQLNESFDRWRETPDNGQNCLVILSSPITSVTRILSEALTEWIPQQEVQFNLLPLNKRPLNLDNIKLKLEHYFKNHDPESETIELVVIPNLSYYFLRSLAGLDGIEYLHEQICNGSHSRFWVIGSNHIAWEYLNCLYSMTACCDEVFHLPTLDGEQLSNWFDPVIEQLAISFTQSDLDSSTLQKEQNLRGKYFQKLAAISQGVGMIALQGFLDSMDYQSSTTDDSDNLEGRIIAQNPKLPDLPNLESADRYLLYSLLLHDDFTIADLAVSLADEVAEVQARVQMLRSQGIIQCRQEMLTVNPIYYYQLKEQLSSNNFIIGG